MTVWFVSRHPGALQWAEEEGLQIDSCVDHLDVAQLAKGDTVIGTLPVNLAAEVCERGAAYLHLSLDLPLAQRGADLDADTMRRYGARLEGYRVTRSVA